MPQPNGQVWRRCRAKLQLTSDQAAEKLGIAGGSLRQIETNTKPVSLLLAYRAEALYKAAEKKLTVDDLIVGEEQQPKPDPDKPKPAPKVERTSPPGRKNGNGNRKGPARADASSRGAA